METIVVEDRTAETPEQVATRRARAIGGALIQTAMALGEGDSGAALLALASALGQAIGQTGVPLMQVVALVKRERDLTRKALEERARMSGKTADA